MFSCKNDLLILFPQKITLPLYLSKLYGIVPSGFRDLEAFPHLHKIPMSSETKAKPRQLKHSHILSNSMKEAGRDDWG
jgi:hypothetical protein